MSSTTDTKVYVCTGKYAKTYHKNTNCKGIKACKSEIKTINLLDAKKAQRTACKICYK